MCVFYFFIFHFSCEINCLRTQLAGWIQAKFTASMYRISLILENFEHQFSLPNDANFLIPSSIPSLSTFIVEAET